nr:hypothetical protein GCM10017745_37900 [Saccharothrix mutabilis subsp. capreolus]
MSPSLVSMRRLPSATPWRVGSGRTTAFQRHPSSAVPVNSSSRSTAAVSSGTMVNQSNSASTTGRSPPPPTSESSPIFGSTMPANALVCGIAVNACPSAL